jgi:hypothetical protein
MQLSRPRIDDLCQRAISSLTKNLSLVRQPVAVFPVSWARHTSITDKDLQLDSTSNNLMVHTSNTGLHQFSTLYTGSILLKREASNMPLGQFQNQTSSKCTLPLLDESLFLSQGGCKNTLKRKRMNEANTLLDQPGRYCGVGSFEGGTTCCFPCPIQDWVYPRGESANVI